jgi:hypothetical protein
MAGNLWIISEEEYFFPCFCFQLSDFDNNIEEFVR